MTNEIEPAGPAAAESGQVVRPVTPLGWLVPVAFVVALVSLFLPWFEPAATKGSVRDDLATLYAWEDGTLFVLPPVALLLASAVTVALLLRRPFGRFRGMADPGRAAGWFVVVVGVISAICVGIEWLLVPSRYPGWDVAAAVYRAQGASLGRNPQFGYLLNAIAAVLALAGGAVMVILSRGDERA